MSKRFQQIREHLLEVDPRFQTVFARVHAPLRPGRSDPYRALLRSIISQQLSVKAAATIHQRFLDLFPGGNPDPTRLRKQSEAALRGAGLSRQKVGYLRNVAAFSMEEGISHAQLKQLSDEEIITHLTQIKGVGRWTVEMLLLFSLDRPDVFPVDDLGIQNAMRKLYRLRTEGPVFRRRLMTISRRWSPHRSTATKLLWKWAGTVDDKA